MLSRASWLASRQLERVDACAKPAEWTLRVQAAIRKTQADRSAEERDAAARRATESAFDGPHGHEIHRCRMRSIGRATDLRICWFSTVGACEAPAPGLPPAETRPSASSTRPSSIRAPGCTIFIGIAGEPPPDPRSNHAGRAVSGEHSRRSRTSGSTNRRSKASSEAASSGSAVRLIFAFHRVEQLKVRLERFEHRAVTIAPSRAAHRRVQALAKLAATSRLRQLEPADISAPRTATAAGVTPGIRSAWPSVSGRTCDSRWTTSREGRERGRTENPSGFGAARPSARARSRSPAAEDSPRTSTVVSTLATSTEAARRVDLEVGSRRCGEQIAKPNLGLAEQLARRHAIARRRSDQRLRRAPRRFRSKRASPRLETLPALVVHKTGLRGRAASAADRRCRCAAAADARRAT